MSRILSPISPERQGDILLGGGDVEHLWMVTPHVGVVPANSRLPAARHSGCGCLHRVTVVVVLDIFF